MKALQLVAPREMEVHTMPDPPDPGPGEVTVRLRSCGVCGSDMHQYLEASCAGTPATYPMVLGHEPAGEVVSVGKGVESLKVGDRVAVEPAIACGKCEFCRTGFRNRCENVVFMGGTQLPGLLREYATMPAENALKIPQTMGFDTAAVIEPVAVLLHSLELAGLRFDETVAVMGAGPIGLLAVKMAKLAGASKVICGDKIPHRLKRATELGADQVVDVSKESMVDAVMDVTGKGAHVIFDAAGKPASINASIRSARPGARIVVIGIPSEPLTAVEFWPALHAEVTIKVQKRNNGNDHEALHLIEAGKVTPEMILSHKFSLEDGGKAFATMGDYSDGVIKPWVEI
ncbi:MAG: alcohol dehydrogenase catalytic domain-containing protein [Acidobacteria bacterium]|nr:alcohol dehydrogenase catalytic domain-containing protein [Acidobacteriota bacterium]